MSLDDLAEGVNPMLRGWIHSTAGFRRFQRVGNPMLPQDQSLRLWAMSQNHKHFQASTSNGSWHSFVMASRGGSWSSVRPLKRKC
jgi:hypothetical protein